jgi:hypothetical protein
MSKSQLKRTARWTLTGLLLVAAYFASFPFALGIADHRYPSVVPITLLIYKPAYFYSDHHRIPGSAHYNRYCRYCMGLTNVFLQFTEPTK